MQDFIDSSEGDDEYIEEENSDDEIGDTIRNGMISVNNWYYEKIEKLRLEATAMLLSGEPTSIVSTVSCIYSPGNPRDWEDLAITINTGDEIKRNEIIHNWPLSLQWGLSKW